ncbi:MAG TPA: Ig-like domain-containing protein [Anaerolineaceae bacterium]|jgi:hypothetical protein
MFFRKPLQILLAALFAWVSTVWVIAPVLAQNATPQSIFRLNINRTFGFSNGSQIRGRFSAEVIGPGTVQSAIFRIDGQPMGQAAQAPFKLDFNTSSYPLGWHNLTATVQLTDGKTFTTPARRFEFVSADQESAVMRNIIFPLLGTVGAIMLVIFGVQFFILRGQPNKNLPLGAKRHYGILGGAICPKCHRPFSIHWYGIKIGFGTKYDRCDFCGRRGLFKVVRPDELARAEAAELESAQPGQGIPALDEETRLKKILDDSRFSDDH